MGENASFRAKAILRSNVEDHFGESQTKRTPFVEVMFQTYNIDGSEGEKVPWQGYFSEKTTTRTIEALKLAGARLLQGDVTDLDGLGSKFVNVTVEPTQYGPRVAWVNPPENSAVNENTKLDKSRLRSLSASLRASVIGTVGAGAGGPAMQPPSPAAAPWAQKAAAPSAAAPWAQKAAAPAPAQDDSYLSGDALPAGRLPPEVEAQLTRPIGAEDEEETSDGEPKRGESAEPAPVAAGSCPF